MVWSSSVNVTGASGELTPDAGRYYEAEIALMEGTEDEPPSELGA